MRKLSFRLTIRNVNSLDLLYSLHSSASFRLTIRNVNTIGMLLAGVVNLVLD